jgi:hypothetical protein
MRKIWRAGVTPAAFRVTWFYDAAPALASPESGGQFLKPGLRSAATLDAFSFGRRGRFSPGRVERLAEG